MWADILHIALLVPAAVVGFAVGRAASRPGGIEYIDRGPRYGDREDRLASEPVEFIARRTVSTSPAGATTTTDELVHRGAQTPALPSGFFQLPKGGGLS
jgi:hypothetical protein